jgi:predicted HNH restriction endonuclease
MDLIGGAICSKCGLSNEPCCIFDFHHKNPADKKFGISSAITKGKTFEVIKPEATKCIVLCKNCHAKVHWKGDVSTYK